MIWRYFNTGYNTGEFNMAFDLNLAQKTVPGEAVLRLYKWKPHCISLGANQSIDSINIRETQNHKIDVVSRPTGGRAILHSDELTYSVTLSLENKIGPREIYQKINEALLEGLTIYDSRLAIAELENEQPNFKQFYSEEKSAICFAVSAKSELKYSGKKLVGSAQRKLGNSILQHGSILCSIDHERIVDFLNASEDSVQSLKKEIHQTTTTLETILDEMINYEKLENSIKKGFERYFNITFEDYIFNEELIQH